MAGSKMAGNGLRIPRSGLLAAVGVLLILTDVGRAQEDGDMSNLESLFSTAVKSEGIYYAQARSAILTRPRQGETLLRSKARSAASPLERWLAEILLVRLAHGGDLEKLEQEFHEKVWNLTFTLAPSLQRLHKPPDMRAVARAGLLPWDDYLKREAEAKDDPRTLEWLKNVRLCKSTHWPPFLEELLLKGWVPTSQVTDPPGPMQVRFKDREAAKAGAKLSQPDYVLQAIVLSGKMKLSRTGDRLLQMLQDERSAPDVRAAAATSLGQLAHTESLPALMKLTTDEAAPRFLRQAAFTAIAEGGFVDAIPLLEQIAAWTPSEPRKDARHWAFTARNTLRLMRMKQGK